MITHDYDEKTRTLVVADDGKEVVRVENLPPEKLKSALVSFVVMHGKDRKAYGYCERVDGYEEKVLTQERMYKTIDPADCPNITCPMRGDAK